MIDARACLQNPEWMKAYAAWLQEPMTRQLSQMSLEQSMPSDLVQTPGAPPLDQQALLKLGMMVGYHALRATVFQLDVVARAVPATAVDADYGSLDTVDALLKMGLLRKEKTPEKSKGD